MPLNDILVSQSYSIINSDNKKTINKINYLGYKIIKHNLESRLVKNVEQIIRLCNDKIITNKTYKMP